MADNNGTLEGITSEYHNKYKVKADGTLELGSDGNPIPVEGMINPEVNVTITHPLDISLTVGQIATTILIIQQMR